MTAKKVRAPSSIAKLTETSSPNVILNPLGQKMIVLELSKQLTKLLEMLITGMSRKLQAQSHTFQLATSNLIQRFPVLKKIMTKIPFQIKHRVTQKTVLNKRKTKRPN